MAEIWTPPTEWEKGVQEIEASDRVRELPDGRQMRESTLTLSPEWIEQIWQGYRCARCLERFSEAYPVTCYVCQFPVRAEQRKQLEQDFIGQLPGQVSGFPIDRELAILEETQHKPKPMMSVPKKLK